MNDSADINLASERLRIALSELVKNLEPILDRVARLEAAVEEGRQFSEDRSRLAQDLDASQANLAIVTAREAKISQLASKTRAELDSAIQDIQALLGKSDGAETGNGAGTDNGDM